MAQWIAAVKKFAAAEDGATMVEYGLMAVLIAGVCFLAVTVLGTNVNSKFNSVTPGFGS